MRKVFIINGLPGSGKGTQAALLAEKLNLIHISSGQLFRDVVASDSKDEAVKQIRERIEKGMPQPDEAANSLVSRKIASIKTGQGIIFDSYPINVKQAKYLLSIAPKCNLTEPVFIHLKVNPESVIKRLSTRKTCIQCGQPVIATPLMKTCPKCGGELVVRFDDREDVVRQRIRNYSPLLQKMVNYYKEKDSLIEINGNQPIEKVAKEIAKKLNI